MIIVYRVTQNNQAGNRCIKASLIILRLVFTARRAQDGKYAGQVVELNKLKGRLCFRGRRSLSGDFFRKGVCENTAH